MKRQQGKPKAKLQDQFKYKEVIKGVNLQMTELKEALKESLPKAVFGSHIATWSVNSATDALVCHRITNKFSIASSKVIDTKKVAVDAYLAYESELSLLKPLKLFGSEDPATDYLLRRARSKIVDACKRVGPFSLWSNFLIDLDVEFTPGETFYTANGETSSLAKLLNLKNWTCTAEVVEEVCWLIYNHRGLKLAAKKHIGHVSSKVRRKLYDVFRTKGCPGFQMFSFLLRSRVLSIVDGARQTTVPKNLDTDRVIEIGPFLNIILQRKQAQYIYKLLKLLGNDVSVQTVNSLKTFLTKTTDAQRLHGAMISDMDYVTADFKSASDSTLIDSCFKLLPLDLFSTLMQTRCSIVIVNKEHYAPVKLSSMGNGFTFEVMTLLLTAIVKSLDVTGRVFGDDVIIKKSCFEAFKKASNRIGYRLNMKKTFTEGYFRESCGFFYHQQFGYLTSFDFLECKTYQDCILTANKLATILIESPISEKMRAVLKNAHEKIVSTFPLLSKGTIPCSALLRRKHLGAFVFCSKEYDVLSKLKRKPLVREYVAKFRSRRADVLESLCYTTEDLDKCSLTFTPMFIPKRSTYKDKKLEYLLSLPGSVRISATVRGKGKWLMLPALISPNGNMMLLRSFRNITRYSNTVIGEIPDYTDKLIVC